MVFHVTAMLRAPPILGRGTRRVAYDKTRLCVLNRSASQSITNLSPEHIALLLLMAGPQSPLPLKERVDCFVLILVVCRVISCSSSFQKHSRQRDTVDLCLLLSRPKGS